MKLTYLIAFLFAFVCSFANPSMVFSQTKTIPVYDASAEDTSLDFFNVYLIKDATRALTIHDIAHGNSKGVLTSSRLYTKSIDVNYWICFSLINNSVKPITRIIHLDEPYYDAVDLYYQKGNIWHKESAGLSIPLEKRQIYNRNPVFTVTIEPGQKTTVYLKLHAKYGMLIVGCYVDSPSAFLKIEQLATAGYFFYFGFNIALILYNLFLFFAFKERVYAYYILHGLFFAVFVSIHSGFDLYADVSAVVHYKLTAVISLVLVFISLFSRELLQTKKHLPRIDTILLAIASTGLVLGIVIAVDIAYYQLLTIIALPTYLFFIFVGVYAWTKRIELSSYYVLSMSLYFLGIILLALLFLEIQPYNLVVRNAYLVGSMAELTIFSLALAHRVKLLQKQNTVYQQELLQAERKAKQRLESQVAERTAELTRLNNELERMARQDGLTGLANRRFLDEELLHQWQRLNREQKTLSVIMCDIDYFKLFNDYYGHLSGDACLVKVAEAIRTSLRRPDDLAGRYGGEEFLILLPDTDTKGAITVATAIRETVAYMALEHAKSQVAGHVTLSFGVASMMPSAECAPEVVVSFADEALYQAKRNGRDQVCIASRRVCG